MSDSQTIRIGDNTIELPTTGSGGQGGGFAFGVYKGGSTMLHTALKRLARNSKTSYVDFVHLVHRTGIVLESAKLDDENIASLERWFKADGTVFGGWRQFPLNYRLPLSADSATYLLVRDPRDVVTSHYYSLKYSHTVSGASGASIVRARELLKNTDIDTFALSQAEKLGERFLAYEALDNTKLMLRRYEDVIFDKVTLLSDVCAHFGMDIPQRKIGRIAQEIDERPSSEDVNAHVRQVTPGDHKNKLKPSTIESLNQVLAKVLLRYGYV